MSLCLAVAACLVLPPPDRAESKTPREIYEATVNSIVAVRALAPLGERSGTGVVLSADGLILTSYAVCPVASTKIRVWLKGPRRVTAELVATSKRDEISLLRIKPEGPLKPILLGSSADVRIGEVSYTFGNAANSIIHDDQPALQIGIISGLYLLDVKRGGATYTGPVLETTAAVNVGMEGAPCLDARGRMVGMLTLNFSPHRFLGAAIPVDGIWVVVERLKKEAEAEVAAAAPPVGVAWLGLEVRERNGRVEVARITSGGPAEGAGLLEGDVLLEAARTPIRTSADLSAWLKTMEVGGVVWLTVEIEGARERIKVTLGARP